MLYCTYTDGVNAFIKNRSRKVKAAPDGEDSDEEEDIPERLSSEEAWMFPIVSEIQCVVFVATCPFVYYRLDL